MRDFVFCNNKLNFNMEWNSVDELFLCTFRDSSNSTTDYQFLTDLKEGHWVSTIKGAVLEILLSGDVKSEAVLTYLEKYNTLEKKYEVLAVGVGSLLLFCELNWTGPEENFDFNDLGVDWPEQVSALSRLELDCEDIDVNVKCPEVFLVACEIFAALLKHEKSLSILWWNLRCKYIHQMIVEENSYTLFKELEEIIVQINEMRTPILDTRCDILLNVEICYVYLHYGHVGQSEEYLDRAKQTCGLQLTLKGMLGFRTKYQTTPVSQLSLEVVKDRSKCAGFEDLEDSVLPPELQLEDDLRLNKIKYIGVDEDTRVTLSSLEQTICLLTVKYLRKSQPRDDLAVEELYPYIGILLQQEWGPWAVRISTLLAKIKLGSNHKRSVETSLQQCEHLVANWSKRIQENDASKRLSYLWASGTSPVWKWKHTLADLQISLGMIKTALDGYLQLRMWEDVIICYSILELRHKAAEIIQQQIDVKPSIKLYCLLGDATDDISCYEKAWETSKHRSSRAQRHWGNYLFSMKKYSECIEHYQLSLNMNSLQENVWLRLGYAALTCENWDVAATAYRRYTFMEPGSFEAWNNLAKVYVKQNDKHRAYKALMESLKYNYDNWQLWENVVAVSIDTGHYDDVVRGYHRLLDLKGKHLDLDVLCLLVRGVMERETTGDEDATKRLIKKVLELFGRLTSIHPNDSELWQLYADMTSANLQRGQRLLKVYGGITQSGSWSKDPTQCERVIRLATSLGETSIKAWNEVEGVDKLQARQLLSSARFTVQGAVRAIGSQKWEQFDASVSDLKKLLEDVSSTLNLASEAN